MKSLISDTNPKMKAFQISLIRLASVAERINKVRSLSSTVIQLSRRAIARANPDLSQREQDLLFVKYHYGEALANRLRRYLDARQSLAECVPRPEPGNEER